MNYYLLSKLCYLIATILLFYLILSKLDHQYQKRKIKEVVVKTQPMKEEN